MDNNINNNRESTEKGEETKNKGEDVQRMAISREALSVLLNVVDQINDGFVGGKVNRTQVANWMVLAFQKNLDEVQIKEIRSEYFDEVAMLESVLKRAKESGKVPADFKMLLQKQLGMDGAPKKKSTRGLTVKPENVIIDDRTK